jgi:hypothetical protein
VERRLSLGLAAAGLLAALAIFVLGRRTSPDDLRAAVTDLDGLIRENAAGTEARADTLAQLPRLGWAVATDENTVRDLTTEELAFRTHPGEHIEITQMPRGGGEPRRLLRLPAESDLVLPVLAGTHVFAEGNHLHVVTVVKVEPHERANELVGTLAVAKQIDTSSIEQRLAAHGISAELRTIRGSVVLSGSAPRASAITNKIALAGPAAEGAELVAANAGRARWPMFTSPLVLMLALVAAVVVRRRASDAHPNPDLTPVAISSMEPEEPSLPEPPTEPKLVPPTATPLAGLPKPTPHLGVPRPTPIAGLPKPTPLAGVPKPTPLAGVPKQTPLAGVPKQTPLAVPALPGPAGTQKPTPVAIPVVPAAAVPEARLDQPMTGRVEIPLARSGSVSVSPRAAGAPPAPPDPQAAADPRTEEYRSLFDEFVKLRRTTGESNQGLDAAHFVQTLREKRAQIMKELRVKDVRFKLAFQNGKAAVRYVTVN